MIIKVIYSSCRLICTWFELCICQFMINERALAIVLDWVLSQCICQPAPFMLWGLSGNDVNASSTIYPKHSINHSRFRAICTCIWRKASLSSARNVEFQTSAPRTASMFQSVKVKRVKARSRPKAGTARGKTLKTRWKGKIKNSSAGMVMQQSHDCRDHHLLAPISLGINFLHYFTLSALEWIAETESKIKPEKNAHVLIDDISPSLRWQLGSILNNSNTPELISLWGKPSSCAQHNAASK